MKTTTTIVLILMIGYQGFGKPRWVKMMENEHTNYFKAIEKFENYWKYHFEPNEENEKSAHEPTDQNKEKDPRRLIVKLFQSEKRAKEKSNELALAYKKFQKWKMEMLPYVKADGSIMNTQERIDAWKQLQHMNANY